jgi:inner membrane protein
MRYDRRLLDLDNLTHSLLGAALAEVALPRATVAPPRRLFVVSGVLAANLPDLDLVYTGITPPPLGYLLHHRGHTHTLVGLVVQAAVLGLVYWLIPAVRRLPPAHRARLWMLISAALLSHLLLDAGNSYGVHPFFPFDSRWYYGDAVFILEPWLWFLLGMPAAWMASRMWTRLALLGFLAILPLGLYRAGVVSPVAVAALFAAGVVFGWALGRFSPQGRAWTAIAASAVFVGVLFGLSAFARAETKELLAPAVRGDILDVVLTPDPGNPVCWSVIVVERDDGAGEYALHSGTLSLAPDWLAPARCASHRYGGPRPYQEAERRLALYDAVRQPLDGLRALRDRDCWVNAWLQFGRAPRVEDGMIFDMRFDRGGRNFTSMALRPGPEGSICPSHLTSWEPPRADLLQP